MITDIEKTDKLFKFGRVADVFGVKYKEKMALNSLTGVTSWPRYTSYRATSSSLINPLSVPQKKGVKSRDKEKEKVCDLLNLGN